MIGWRPSITGWARSARASAFLMALIPPMMNIEESIGRAMSRTRVMGHFYLTARHPAGHRVGDRDLPSRRQPVEVAREKGDLADVGRLDQPPGPALEPDGEAAVRWDAIAEGVDVGVVRRLREAPLPRARRGSRRTGAAAALR